MNRIDAAFANLAAADRKALVAYLTAGYPDFDTSLEILKQVCGAGADILEIGVPFSDPTCDGPIIQASSETALKSGMSLSKSIELAAALRQSVETPIVMFSYYNPVFRYGVKRFAEEISRAGVDGVLIVDLPPEEAGDLVEALAGKEIHIIRLAAPTTRPERIRMLAGGAGGFLYLISRTGVTGTGGLDPAAIALHAAAVKKVCPHPVCIGFGISNSDDARALAPLADGIIVGSALMRVLSKADDFAAIPALAAAKIRELRVGMDAAGMCAKS
ncbi:MAG: tryptophan synthase subunit alpha [Kiritimatiellae bacterium]|nr:tryptophan synthase subunit alpha [Kiritimatiellia bacterium]